MHQPVPDGHERIRRLGRHNASFNFCYTYNAGYWIIEYAYGEVANEGAANLLPVIWGDGYFYQGTSGGGYYAPDDRALRQEWWWTLASGSRGVLGEAENLPVAVNSRRVAVPVTGFSRTTPRASSQRSLR